MPSQLWCKLRIQSCDQYGQTLVFERHLDEVASQHSAPFLVRATSELRGAACGAKLPLGSSRPLRARLIPANALFQLYLRLH